MAKPIFVKNDDIETILTEIKSKLLGSKCYGSFEFKRSFENDKRRAILSFTPTAWIKMTSLVSDFDTEVQWHGLVRRVSESEFEVYDILVPPHDVGAATVTSNQEKYEEWINGLDDNTFDALRFHGHSHVKMEVSPSSVDTDYRKDVVTQLPKPTDTQDMFYIFLIINKYLSWSAEIYDLTNNALYSTNTKDIDLNILLDDGSDVKAFVAEAKKVAVVPRVTQTTYGKNTNSTYKQNSSIVNSAKDDKKNAPSQKQAGFYYEGRFYPYDDEDKYDNITDPFYSKEGRWY